MARGDNFNTLVLALFGLCSFYTSVLTHFLVLFVCFCCCFLDFCFNAVPVADIKAVVTGKDCPHMKEKGALKQNKVWLSNSYACTP